MKPRSVVAVAALAAALVACGGSSGGDAAAPSPTAATTAAAASAATTASAAGGAASSAAVTTAPPAGSSAGSAAASGLCAVFTPAELADKLGAKLGAGKTAGPLGSACQWDGPVDEYVQLQVVEARYFETRDRSIPGYRAIPELGDGAWSVPELGGWACGAPAPADKATFVSAVGPKASADLCIEVLKLAVERTS